MPKSSASQDNFNGGEVTPLIFGRPDLDKYGTGLALCENFTPLVQGPLERRPSTTFMLATKNAATEKARLMPFVFNKDQAYIIELGNLYFRVFKDRARLGTIDVVTPYLEADLFQIKVAQSADILYVAHPAYAPRVISRFSDTNWTLSKIDFEDGPFTKVNTTDTTLLLSGVTGSVTVTASAITGINKDTGFQTTDVDRLIRWKDAANNWTWLKITAYTSTTVVTATVMGDDASATTATVDWRLGVWSDTTGWPATVTFHQDRLTWGGGVEFSQRVVGSRTGDFFNMSPTDPDGTVVGDHSIDITLSANGVNSIVWLEDDEKGLVCGTSGGEWIITPSTLGEAITPTNVQAKQSSQYGSADITPFRVGKAVLFVQRGGNKVRDLSYVFESDGFQANDSAVVAEHITESGLVELAYQQEPQSILWSVRNDGVLLGLTFVRPESIAGWHRHTLGGTSDAAGAAAKVESIVSIPNPSGNADDLIMIVQRWINGAVTRHIEYLNAFWRTTTAQEDAKFVDSAVTVDSPITITGITKADSTVITAVAHGLSDGDEVATVEVAGMTEVNGNNYLVADQVTNSFTIVNKVAIAVKITGATQANPVVITAVAHGLSDGDVVAIYEVAGMVELNGLSYTVANKTANTFELTGINGTGFTAFTSDGNIHPVIDSTAFTTYISGGEVRERITAVSGLSHLEGESVDVLADGAVQPSQTVSGGAVTLVAKASVIQIGLGYVSNMQTLRNNTGAADGTAQGKTKRIHRLITRFHETLGGKFGPDGDTLDRFIHRKGGDPMDTAVPLFTGDVEQTWNKGYDKNGQIYIRQDQPLPMTIVALYPQLNTQDR